MLQSLTCTPGLGYLYTRGNSGPSKVGPELLWFTAGNQLAAFGVRVWGTQPSSYIGKYWTANNDGTFDMSVVLRRNTSAICDPNFTYQEPIGDSVTMGGISVPVTETAAGWAGWTRGACVNSMGTHWSLDISTRNGTMSWDVDNFYPLVAMYNVKTKALTGVFIAVPDLELLYPLGVFEGPFPNSLLCVNWCKNTGCGFSPNAIWSTLHWMFSDTTVNTCAGSICHFP
jgi:hypothetical protein